MLRSYDAPILDTSIGTTSPTAYAGGALHADSSDPSVVASGTKSA